MMIIMDRYLIVVKHYGILFILLATQWPIIVKGVQYIQQQQQQQQQQTQQQQQYSKKLNKENFLIDIAEIGAHYENSTSQCGRELQLLQLAANQRELWTMKLLDAFGSPPKQFIWGNFFWLSNPDLCHDLNQPYTINLGYGQPKFMNVTSPFQLQFTVIYLNFTTPFYIDLHLIFQNVIHLGLCLPKSCSLEKLRFFTDRYFENQQQPIFEMQRYFRMSDIKTIDSKAPHFSWTFVTQTSTILCCLIICTVITLIILAEYYGYQYCGIKKSTRVMATNKNGLNGSCQSNIWSQHNLHESMVMPTTTVSASIDVSTTASIKMTSSCHLAELSNEYRDDEQQTHNMNPSLSFSANSSTCCCDYTYCYGCSCCCYSTTPSTFVKILSCFRFKSILTTLLSLEIGIKQQPENKNSNQNRKRNVERHLNELRLCQNSNRYQNGHGMEIFTCLTGMRTIVCLWITVFHVYYYSMFALSNRPFMIAKLEYFAYQPVAQACYYVDVFFIMSAFLLVYNFLMNVQQTEAILQNNWRQNVKMYLRSILRRYMRLTPVLISTMILSDMFYNLVNMYTPFHLDESFEIYCKKNWWYNLLYIQNFLDMNQICCSWTWYLACEMQYFILITTLLFLHVKYPKLIKILCILLTIGFVIIAWLLNYSNRLTFQIDVIYSTVDRVYNKPWMRIIPYMGGTLMGYLMYHLNRKSLQQQQQQQQQQPKISNGLNGIGQEDKTHCQQDNYHQQQQSQQSQQPQQQYLKQQEEEEGQKQLQRHIEMRPPSAFYTNRNWNCCIKRIAYKTFWLICFIIYIYTNFMSYWRSTPIWIVATIMSVGKLIFSLCIGGIIILCSRNLGGPLNTFLSSTIFQFCNKFCYSIYMLAPLGVVVMFALRNEPTNFTEAGSGADFLGVIALSIVGSFLMLILIEIPMQRLTNVLMHQRKSIAN